MRSFVFPGKIPPGEDVRTNYEYLDMGNKQCIKSCRDDSKCISATIVPVGTHESPCRHVITASASKPSSTVFSKSDGILYRTETKS